MKKLKISFAAAMILLGSAAAFATKAHHDPSDKKWARNHTTGVYSDITGQEKNLDYRCNEAAGICTVTYAAGVDPANPGTATPQETEMGEFQ